MKARPTRLETPTRYPYMVATLPERGDVHLQIPSLLSVARLVKGLQRSHLTLVAGMAGQLTPTAMLALLKESGPELAAVLGALVGLAWRHEELELETTRGADLIVYGEDVFEELHGAGYTLSELAGIALTVIQAIWEHSQLSAEVQARAGFIFPAMVRSSSPVSTSGSTISETPSGSTN